MLAREVPVRKDSRMFAELCSALLNRGLGVRFRAQGKSMSPNILDGDDVVIVPASTDELHRGDIVLAENSDGLCVHRLHVCDPASGNFLLRSETGHECDPSATRIFGKVLSRNSGFEEETLTPFQTRFVHPLRSLGRRVLLATQSRLRRFVMLLGAIVLLLFVIATLLAPAVVAQTADLQLTQTASSSAVATSATTQSLGTATTAAWSTNVASFTFPAPLPSGAVTNALLTTTGFTAAAYNVTNATITSANSATGVVTVALASQSLGRVTTVAWAGGVATYTFPAGLPTYAVPGAQMTTTGCVPAAYNLTNATILTATSATGVITVALAANPGALTTRGNGTVGPGTSTVNGTGTVPTGYTYSEVVTNNTSSATVTTGTITVYMQTPANTTFLSYSGTNWTCTTPTTGNTGPVVCTYNTTLASGATASTLSISYQINTGVAAGTTIQGSATVTNSTFTDTAPANNTSLTSIVVEPTTTSDLSVAMTVSPTPVFVNSTLVYTITAQNLGQATLTATSNVVVDNIPTGTTISSFTQPATGWSCATTATALNCSLTGTLAMGATATFTVTLTAPTTATTLTSSALINLATDPNSNNNVSTVVTVVQPIVCATPGKDGAGGALTGIVNAYYPPSATGTVAAGSTSVVLAAAAAGGAQKAIALGDLLLIMQAQDASINGTNTSSYGHNVPGDPAAGSITLGSSGLFEFVTATNAVPVTGGTLNFTATGTTGGLLNSYIYTLPATASLGTASAASWAANSASFTFPAPLPASVVKYSALTTTGFTPAGYNLTNVPITSVNTATGVITVALTTNPGAATALGTGSFTTQGRQTYQVIRVPQYTSATLGSGLVPLAWNGSVGGVLAIDVSSQLTLGGTVALDALGFRGGGGKILAGAGTGAVTDYAKLATNPANASKGEGIAGTPRYIAPATITNVTTATDTTGGAPADTLPGGSFARGAPGNAGGGGTDGDPAGNSENSGGGAGGNGGTGGQGGYGWNSLAATNSTDGGFGGVSFLASTSALVMGGGGGAGTTNDGSYYISAASNGADCGATCTGIYSSGGAGGGIAIIHAGSVTGTGTITSNGQGTLSTLNDSTGGGGAGGSILVFANSGTLSGLTVNAIGGNAGNAWPAEAPGGFPGERHGPGGGGGGGVIFLSALPANSTCTTTLSCVAGGSNGYTDTVQDSFGATPGQSGLIATTHVITETPGTQPGAYCGSADLAVTNSGSPTVVAPGGAITYTQSVTNGGPLDAVNAVFTEAIPANTTFQSITSVAGWTCTTPAVGGTGTISCTNPDVAASSVSPFTVVVNVASATTSGTQIVDVDNVSSGTSDPNLANNTATAVTTVGVSTSADLAITNTANPIVVNAGSTVTMTAVVTNNGPASATSASFTESTPGTTTFNSLVVPPGWSCSTPTAGTSGSILCTAVTVAAGAVASFPVVLNVPSGTASGTQIADTANVSSPTPDSNPSNNTATATATVATAGQADLAVSASGTPNPVTQGNNISYVQSVANNGPATETNATFTDTIPTNTTLVSFTPPANWTCNTIAVGGTGTFTCTLNTGQTITSGSSVNFPLVVKVNAGTTSGTITNTPSVASTVGDPNPGNNSATVTTIVASPSQADVSIIKSAAPEPVNQGTNLTYTLMVTNGGPAVAQGVAVTDVIPSQVSYTSSSASQGSCTYTSATTTVNCSLGSLSVGSTIVVTINATANTFSSSTVTCNGIQINSCNTATVSTTTSNVSLNTSSSAGSTIQAPTAVDIASFHASVQPDGSVVLEWRTQEESRNLGFHIYREQGSGLQRITPSLIAGSALLLRGSLPQHAAKLYRWIDPQPAFATGYWIEDVDINGTRTMHGPASVESASTVRPVAVTVSAQAQAQTQAQISPLLRDLHAVAVSPNSSPRPLMIPWPRPPLPPVGITPVSVADHNAVKISVDHEGWYHIALADLIAAGLDPNTNTHTLRLFAEGVEQPFLITNTATGVGSSTSNEAIEFYGTGIDTPFSAERVYWLIRDFVPGKRISLDPPAASGTASPNSFPFTVILEQRITYFAALLNGENNDNFFGAVVTTDPVDQQLTVAHIDPTSSLPVTIDLTLQGATDGQLHSVNVQFNGSTIGEMDFQGLTLATQTISVNASLLQEGTNTVTLTAINGDNDVSVVQSIQLHYGHTYAADADWLRATAPAGSALHISGFTNSQVRVFDITDPLNISEINGKVSADSGAYDISFTIPRQNSGVRTLLAFSAAAISSPDSLVHHVPSLLDDRRAGADVVIVSHPDFVSALSPLVQLRESQNHHVLLVTTDEVYDEYNFGERSPSAIRSFLNDAAAHWQLKPQSVLFVGDASFDPRDYLGLGYFDFVPTRMIETAAFKTSSDDWFTDFQSNGYATIPTGRLPVRTVADTQLVVAKIVNYELGTDSSSWNSQALLVADQNVNSNFSSAVMSSSALLPSSLNVSEILADSQDPATVRAQLIASLNNGALLVNYQGHGAEQQWSFSDIFDNDAATALTNGGHLPVYLLMDCLNGFFQDVYGQSLAEAVLLAPNGGGVAVWASSGFTEQAPQASMNQAFLVQLAAHPNESLGRMILQAKSGTTDNDVRRTWILFGDPAMKLHFAPTSATPNKGHQRTSPATPSPIASPCNQGSSCVKGKLQE